MSVVFDWVAEDQVKYFMDFVPVQLQSAYEKRHQVMIYGIAVDHVAVGAAVVHVMQPESVLNYIYVAPDYRGRGLCGECISHLGYALWKTGVHWLTARYIPGEQETLHRWFMMYGAWADPSGCGSFRFTPGDMKDNKNLAGSTEGVSPLSDCGEAELAMLGRQMQQRGAVLVPLPVNAADYDADCSCVYRKDGGIGAVLLVKRHGDTVDIPLLYSDAGSPAVVLLLMRYALREGLKRFPEETVCTLRSVDEPMTKLLVKLLERPVENETFQVTLPFTAYDEYHRQFMELLLEEPVDLSGLAGESAYTENNL